MLKILGAPSAAVLAACVAVSACTNQVSVAPTTGASGPSEARVSFARFPDLPLPSEAEINLDGTLRGSEVTITVSPRGVPAREPKEK